VSVHYVGTLHGTADVFDSSRDRGEPFTFSLGKGEVIRGWDAGVATMKRGEKCVLTCRADAAYGAAGSPPKIPPDATLDFEVELLSWRSVKDLSGDGGVVKTVAAEGEGWMTPGDADEVVVAYEVRAGPAAAAEEGAGAGGKKKKKKGGKGSDAAAAAAAADDDASPKPPALLSSPPEGAAFTVREGHLCRGLARAVRTMKVGEKAVLRVRAADYAPELLAAAGGPLPAGCEAAEIDVALLELRKVEQVCPGVVKKTMNEVDGWKRPNDGATVRLRVRATLPPAADGAPAAAAAAAASPPAPFWERLEGDELEVVLGDGHPPHPLPEALEDALLKMKEGERCLVTVSDPELAYGPAGWPDAPLGVPVPPHASPLTFDVELVAVTKSREQWEMGAADKLAASAAKKDRGNAAYSAGATRAALKHYAKAAELLGLVTDRDLDEVAAPGPPAYEAPMAVDGGAEEEEDAPAGAKKEGGPTPAELRRRHRDLRKAVALNQAAAALRAKDYALARDAATRALDVDPSNAKGLYRRAQALAALGELVEAERDVRAALDADPASADVRALERRVRAQARAQDKKEAKVYGRMLAALGGGGAKGAKGGGGAAGAEAGEEKMEVEAAAAAEDKEGAAAVAAAAAAAAAAEAPAVVEASA
jgi:FKBP-type peptidyl-prolyl cis-trans isomerase/tetratricopeptide (TPR) repeat protein